MRCTDSAWKAQDRTIRPEKNSKVITKVSKVIGFVNGVEVIPAGIPLHTGEITKQRILKFTASGEIRGLRIRKELRVGRQKESRFSLVARSSRISPKYGRNFHDGYIVQPMEAAGIIICSQ